MNVVMLEMKHKQGPAQMKCLLRLTRGDAESLISGKYKAFDGQMYLAVHSPNIQTDDCP